MSRRRTRFWNTVGIAIPMVILMLGCGAPGSPAPVHAAGTMVDSAEAVQLSTAGYLARFPEYPVRVTEVRTDGRDWYVTLQPDTLVLGGGGIVRVTPRRKIRFVKLYQ